jgi:hypothetical protein
MARDEIPLSVKEMLNAGRRAGSDQQRGLKL